MLHNCEMKDLNDYGTTNNVVKDDDVVVLSFYLPTLADRNHRTDSNGNLITSNLKTMTMVPLMPTIIKSMSFIVAIERPTRHESNWNSQYCNCVIKCMRHGLRHTFTSIERISHILGNLAKHNTWKGT